MRAQARRRSLLTARQRRGSSLGGPRSRPKCQQLILSHITAAPHLPAQGEKALDFEGPVQPSAARLSERLAMAGLDVLTTGVWLLGRLRGTRCWPALGLQRRAPEPPVWTAEASTWPSLAPRPCGTTLLSPAKELVNGRATLRSFASHKRRKAVAQDQKEAPSSACSTPGHFFDSSPEKNLGTRKNLPHTCPYHPLPQGPGSHTARPRRTAF